MEHKEAECRAPEGPILCINNCGFFGSAATMNMCSKCHKDIVLKQEQAKLAAASIDSIVNGGGSSSSKNELIVVGGASTAVGPVNPVTITSDPLVGASSAAEEGDPMPKEGPSRCNTCRKRVGLTGFSCRCGHIFCSTHRYSDKHNCPFDYFTDARDAIAKANPVIKTSKLDKI